MQAIAEPEPEPEADALAEADFDDEIGGFKNAHLR